MHSFTLVGPVVALLACVSSASPIEKRGSFTVPTRRYINTRDPNAGPNAMMKAYRKFGFQAAALEKRQASAANATGTATGQTGVVSAVPEPNLSEFLENVNVGGQNLNLDFDTGSSDLWVFSTALSKNTIGQHSAYDPTKSANVQAMPGATWQISYGDGSGAAGTVVKDTVKIGSATVTGQAVEMATAISASFAQDTNNDGLLGLAFSKLNTVQPQQQKTFFDSVMPSLAAPVFSVDLRNDSTGTYTFGAIDMTKVAGGNLTSVPVNSTMGFWQVTSNQFAVGGQTVQNPNASPAIADTGTSLLLVDDAVATAYYSQVQGAQLSQAAGGFVYPCNAQLPSMSVALGNYMATIPGNQVTFAQVNAQTCFGGIQSNGGSGLQIYGDTMFKTQYVVFQGGATPQLMIAPKA